MRPMGTLVSAPDAQEREPSIASLWRLAAWGLSAAAALGLAATATYSEAGSRRLMAAVKGAGDGPAANIVVAKSSSRAHEIEAGTAPLLEAVQALAAERAQLAERVERIEHHLDDLTGSIKAAGSFTTASMPRS